MERLLAAIVADDRATVQRLLQEDSSLAKCLVQKPRFYEAEIFHWLYACDTALHLAAAGYRLAIVRSLLQAGADPDVIGKHRDSRPLHYAADGYINGPAWDAKRQVSTLRCLLAAGADIDAQDKNGATALHRAVRPAAPLRCNAFSKQAPIRCAETNQGQPRFTLPCRTPAGAAAAATSPAPRNARSSPRFAQPASALP
jgi:ankyrin repeat protein